MRQLTGVDASFLFMENDHTVGHVSGVIMLDPSTAEHPIDAHAIREYIRARIHLLDPLRWRLVNVPMGIDLPYWIEDPDLDLSYHVRGIALPSPGTPEQLAEQAARIVARRLDRTRPLWEIYVIEGLQDGNVAILSKNHHAAIDGKAGMQILSTLLEPTATPRQITPPDTPAPEPIPSDMEMWTRGWVGLLSRPEAAVQLASSVAKEISSGMAALINPAGGKLSMFPALDPSRVPRMPWNTTLSARRNWAYGSVSLDEVKRVKSAFGATVNDVAMAICAGALRRWLIDHDQLPEGPLYSMVPVSTRTADQAGSAGNQVSSMVAELPTHLPDPLQRLQAVHNSMVSAKEMHEAVPAELLTDFSNFTAPAAAEMVALAAAKARWADRVQLPFNVCISNVPGPRETLYYAGAEMLASFPFSIVSDGLGLNITLQSYRDHIDFGVVGTPELVPDIWKFIDYLQLELDSLSQVIDSAENFEVTENTEVDAEVAVEMGAPEHVPGDVPDSTTVSAAQSPNVAQPSRIAQDEEQSDGGSSSAASAKQTPAKSAAATAKATPAAKKATAKKATATSAPKTGAATPAAARPAAKGAAKKAPAAKKTARKSTAATQQQPTAKKQAAKKTQTRRSDTNG